MQPTIFVTGAPRSGTTFVGKMLCLPRHMTYLDEPFNYQTGLQGIQQPLVYLDPDTPKLNDYYLQLVRKMLEGRGRFHSSLLPQHPSLLKTAGRRVLGSRKQLRYQLDTYNPRRTRYLIKDPMACFAAGYLHDQLKLKSIVIIRHPASTIASYKRLRWHYNLTDLTSQPQLMSRYLEPILGPLQLNALTPVQAWSYFWLAVYIVLEGYLHEFPDIQCVTHEHLSRDPAKQLAQLYKHCGLPWSQQVHETVAQYTGSHNPTEPESGAAHTLRRNSAENIQRWKHLLDRDEVHEIRRITEPLACKYYTDADW
jgi:hypothetical protein